MPFANVMKKPTAVRGSAVNSKKQVAPKAARYPKRKAGGFLSLG